MLAVLLKKPFIPKRVLIVSKTTRLQYELRRFELNLKKKNLENSTRKNGQDLDRKNGHDLHIKNGLVVDPTALHDTLFIKSLKNRGTDYLEITKKHELQANYIDAIIRELE